MKCRPSRAATATASPTRWRTQTVRTAGAGGRGAAAANRPLIHPPTLPRHVPPLPPDFLLINWCSVQRVMRRCNVLADERVAALTELGFDWSGADPLS